jgi:putative aldouronate transport system permease protein
MAMNFLSPTSGVINQLIVALGGKATNFMVLPQCFRTIYISSGVWQEMGWESIIYLAALSGVDPQLYEAAKIDGANKFKQLTHITIPTILPTIIILFILRVGSMMSIGAEKVLLLYNPLTYITGDVINTYVYRVGIGNNQMSYGAAVGLFQSVINCAIIFSVNKICRKVSEVSLW